MTCRKDRAVGLSENCLMNGVPSSLAATVSTRALTLAALGVISTFVGVALVVRRPRTHCDGET